MSETIIRCRWATEIAEFHDYHDTEWGFPVADDMRLFEKLCLESFQSGLSWRTILNKRDGFRAAFDHFDFHKIANYDENDVARLLGDKQIIRHKGKITAVINNAARAVDMVNTEGSLAAYFWQFEENPHQSDLPQTRSTSPNSERLARDLKRRGWKFLGPTTLYAFMQSMGLINDHAKDCFMRPLVEEARQNFQRPSNS